MDLRFLQLPAAFVVVGIASTVSGACFQPEDTFDDFGERYDKIDEASDPSATATVSTGLIVGCVPPGPESAVAGSYIFALSAQLINEKPIFFKADVSFGDPATAPSMTIVLHPLRTPYRNGSDNEGIPIMTEVGDTISIGPIPLDAQGSYAGADLGKDVTVSGLANPFSPNNLVATITLGGSQVCDVNPGEAPRVICGGITGEVTKPIPLELDGQNDYAMTKLTDDVIPAPEAVVYNCAGDLAVPKL